MKFSGLSLSGKMSGKCREREIPLDFGGYL